MKQIKIKHTHTHNRVYYARRIPMKSCIISIHGFQECPLPSVRFLPMMVLGHLLEKLWSLIASLNIG